MRKVYGQTDITSGETQIVNNSIPQPAKLLKRKITIKPVPFKDFLTSSSLELKGIAATLSTPKEWKRERTGGTGANRHRCNFIQSIDTKFNAPHQRSLQDLTDKVTDLLSVYDNKDSETVLPDKKQLPQLEGNKQQQKLLMDPTSNQRPSQRFHAVQQMHQQLIQRNANKNLGCEFNIKKPQQFNMQAQVKTFPLDGSVSLAPGPNPNYVQSAQTRSTAEIPQGTDAPDFKVQLELGQRNFVGRTVDSKLQKAKNSTVSCRLQFVENQDKNNNLVQEFKLLDVHDPKGRVLATTLSIEEKRTIPQSRFAPNTEAKYYNPVKAVKQQTVISRINVDGNNLFEDNPNITPVGSLSPGQLKQLGQRLVITQSQKKPPVAGSFNQTTPIYGNIGIKSGQIIYPPITESQSRQPTTFNEQEIVQVNQPYGKNDNRHFQPLGQSLQEIQSQQQVLQDFKDYLANQKIIHTNSSSKLSKYAEPLSPSASRLELSVDKNWIKQGVEANIQKRKSQLQGVITSYGVSATRGQYVIRSSSNISNEVAQYPVEENKQEEPKQIQIKPLSRQNRARKVGQSTSPFKKGADEMLLQKSNPKNSYHTNFTQLNVGWADKKATQMRYHQNMFIQEPKAILSKRDSTEPYRNYSFEQSYMQQIIQRITQQLNLSNEQVDMQQLQAYIAMRLKQQPQDILFQQERIKKQQENIFAKAELHQVRFQSISGVTMTTEEPEEAKLLAPTHIIPDPPSSAQQVHDSKLNSSSTAIRSQKAPYNRSDSRQKQPVPTYIQKATVAKPIKHKIVNRVPIYHIYKDVHGDHKINIIIKKINQIVRLIFKNTKDSQAITAGSGGSVMIPALRNPSEDLRFQELARIIKTMNINIPKKFESKTALREFFYSREFILNLKIKMNEQLHSAILSSNHVPKSCVQGDGNTAENAQAAGSASPRVPDPRLNLPNRVNRFWVGLGNNSSVVKSVLKQRYWWQKGTSENLEEVDFVWTSWKRKKHIDHLQEVNRNHRRNGEEDPVTPIKLYNKLEQNKQLTNKKGIFVNMLHYYESMGEDPFKVLPFTFHTKKGLKDPEFAKFTAYYANLETKIKNLELKQQKAIQELKNKLVKNTRNSAGSDYEDDDALEHKEITELKKQMGKIPKNTWIIKPGENTNRGNGIEVCKSLQEIKSIVGRATKGDRTFIIQKYIDYPLLVHKRKFDFRCYGILTSINGSLKGYFFEDGYIRTSCREFNLEDFGDKFVHLTNDAIQVHADDYGKYESGNKMSFSDFSKVISAQQLEVDFDMYRDIVPQMRKLVADTYRCAINKIDPERLQNTFELFGYDFMLDENYRLYLIEVNTNPCLDCGCTLLSRLIPELLDNCFRIVLDPLFPSPDLSLNRKFQLNELPQEIKFTLCFDEDIEGDELRKQLSTVIAEEEIESDQEQELQEDEEENLGKDETND